MTIVEARIPWDREAREALNGLAFPRVEYEARIERLKNWKGSLLGGHDEPPSGLIEIADTVVSGRV